MSPDGKPTDERANIDLSEVEKRLVGFDPATKPAKVVVIVGSSMSHITKGIIDGINSVGFYDVRTYAYDLEARSTSSFFNPPYYPPMVLDEPSSFKSMSESDSKKMKNFERMYSLAKAKRDRVQMAALEKQMAALTNPFRKESKHENFKIHDGVFINGNRLGRMRRK